VEHFDYEKSAKQARIPLICVYDHPTDYPDKFIARLWDCSTPTNIIATADTLDELRAKIPDCMVRIDRHRCIWKCIKARRSDTNVGTG